MKIGIIGSNGFVGRSLCSKYLIEKCTVYAFYNQKNDIIPDGCILVSLEADFTINLDCLIIAIGGHSGDYKDYLDQYLLIQNIIKKIKFHKIIFISSVQVYGVSKNKISINTCFNNPNLYGLSKITQEFLICSLPNYIIIRPTYLYGEGMNENSLLPIWINKVKNQKDIIIFGDGNRKQDYLHINDLTQLCWLATIKIKKNIKIIAASGLSFSNKELAEQIISNFSISKIEYSGEDKTVSSTFDISFTKKTLGWIPKYSIKNWLKNIK